MKSLLDQVALDSASLYEPISHRQEARQARPVRPRRRYPWRLNVTRHAFSRHIAGPVGIKGVDEILYLLFGAIVRRCQQTFGATQARHTSCVLTRPSNEGYGGLEGTMKVVSVINFKGGVGKTTVTASLGGELARRGYRVLLIDLDPHETAAVVLDHELRQWESTSLEYRTHFQASRQFPAEVRRPAFARARNIDLAVHFDGAPPRHAWWCVWSDHVDANPLREVPETIRKASIRRYVPFIEQTVVGFRWEW